MDQNLMMVPGALFRWGNSKLLLCLIISSCCAFELSVRKQALHFVQISDDEYDFLDGAWSKIL
jgi:hypothetical protein